MAVFNPLFGEGRKKGHYETKNTNVNGGSRALVNCDKKSFPTLIVGNIKIDDRQAQLGYGCIKYTTKRTQLT